MDTAEKTIREVLRLGQLFLGEQLKSGLASDVRAMTLAAVLAAVIAGLVGGMATVIAAHVEIGLHIASIIFLGTCLAAAMYSAVRAARPTGFSFSGNNPLRWHAVHGEGENLIRALAVQASFYADGIDKNGVVLRDSHRFIDRAL